MLGLAALKGPVVLAGVVLVMLLTGLVGWIVVLRADKATLEAEKATLEAQAIAFDIACRSNTDRLEARIAAQNAAIAAREREMAERAAAIAEAEKAARDATETHERLTAEIMAETPAIDSALVGVEKELALCKVAIDSLRRTP